MGSGFHAGDVPIALGQLQVGRHFALSISVHLDLRPTFLSSAEPLAQRFEAVTLAARCSRKPNTRQTSWLTGDSPTIHLPLL